MEWRKVNKFCVFSYLICRNIFFQFQFSKFIPILLKPLINNESKVTFICPSAELIWVTTQGSSLTFLFWIWMKIEQKLPLPVSSNCATHHGSWGALGDFVTPFVLEKLFDHSCSVNVKMSFWCLQISQKTNQIKMIRTHY